jgi:hypothetical protein
MSDLTRELQKVSHEIKLNHGGHAVVRDILRREAGVSVLSEVRPEMAARVLASLRAAAGAPQQPRTLAEITEAAYQRWNSVGRREDNDQ